MVSSGSLFIVAAINTMLLAALAFYQRFARRRPHADASTTKPTWVYWSWRVSVPIAYSAFAFVMVRAIVELDMSLLLLAGVGLSPFLAATIYAAFTVQAFSLDYSVFGKYRRTPFPNEVPLRIIPFSYAIIGKLRTGPLVTWEIYRDGIGIKIASIGDVFLPLIEMDGIGLRAGFLGPRSEIFHHCPEVGYPILVPTNVARIIAACYPNKVIVPTEAA